MTHRSGPDPDQARRRAVFEQHQAHAIILLDAEGRVLEWLAGAERIFGWRADEMRGAGLERLFTPEDQARGADRQELQIARATGESPDDRWQVRREGSRFWAEGVVTALHDPGGELVGFVKVLRNRTESRGETELLENRIRALEERGARKDVFLATVVHELRGPLAPLANAMRIIEGLARSQPDLAFPSGIIARQLAALGRLVDDLTEMVRLGSGKLELSCRTADLNEVVQGAVDSCLDQVRARRQQLEALLPPNPTLWPVDRDRIHQVLLNLITNASKYTPAGGHIWVQLTVEADEAALRVKDDGIGIRPEMQSRIFELFTQIPDGRSMSQGGLGLGLPLVREIVHLHGGSVQVHSEGENRGSEFVVKLPKTR